MSSNILTYFVLIKNIIYKYTIMCKILKKIMAFKIILYKLFKQKILFYFDILCCFYSCLMVFRTF